MILIHSVLKDRELAKFTEDELEKQNANIQLIWFLWFVPETINLIQREHLLCPISATWLRSNGAVMGDSMLLMQKLEMIWLITQVKNNTSRASLMQLMRGQH